MSKRQGKRKLIINFHEVNNISQNIPQKYNYLSFFVSILAILVSVGSLLFSWRQTDIMQNSQTFELQENQPIFRIEYIKDKDKYGHITEILDIQNHGREAKNIVINNLVYLEYKEARPTTVKTTDYTSNTRLSTKVIDIPIISYFNSKPKIKSLKGNVLRDSIINNYSKYLLFDRECEEYSSDTVLYSSKLYKFLIVDYIDIYNISHRLFYVNGEPDNEDRFQNIINENFGINLLLNFSMISHMSKSTLLSYHVQNEDK